MIGVYNHVWLSPYNIEQIIEFKIEKKFNRHDKAYIKGIISETSLIMFQNMIDGKNIVTLYHEQNEKVQLIFAGFVKSIKISEVGSHKEVMIELDGLTQALDRVQKFKDYQDETKKNVTIIENVMEEYPDIRCQIACEEERIGEFLLQYEETDYEFLRRILSRVEAPIYTTATGKYGQIHLGLERRNSALKIEQAEYEVSFDSGLQYTLMLEEHLDLGMQVDLEGNRLIVKAAVHQYREGEFVNEYILGTKASCSMKQIKNEKVTGVSLDGVIVDCQRHRVKVDLYNTPKCPKEELCWFAYSSPAASSDGSGWYCMPEKEEEIRLFCPTNDEKEAYVISAIRKEENRNENDSEGEGTIPQNKVLSNANGQTVSFVPEGVKMSCGDGSSQMCVNSDGTIEIIADKNIYIYSQEAIFMRGEKGICIKATQTVSLTNDTGSSLILDNQVTEQAKRIKNNC